MRLPPRWKWAVVTAAEVGVCKLSEGGDPVADGKRLVVHVLEATRRRSQAVRRAPEWRERLMSAGRLSDANSVEVWSRAKVEEQQVAWAPRINE